MNPSCFLYDGEPAPMITGLPHPCSLVLAPMLWYGLWPENMILFLPPSFLVETFCCFPFFLFNLPTVHIHRNGRLQLAYQEF